MRRGILALFTGNLLGKIVGVARELVLAGLFGTTVPVGALRVATTGTLVPVNLFTADALSVGFLPNHSRYLSEDRRAAAVYYRAVRGLMLTLGLALAISIALSREWWVTILAPGVSGPITSLAAAMLGVMAFGVPFYVHVNLASYLEMSFGKYVLASARPAVQSVGLVLGTVSAFVLNSPVLLAWGFTAAYIAMSFWAALRVSAGGYAAIDGQRPSARETRHALGRFGKTIAPVLWVPVISQGAWVVERAVTSFLGTDAVAALDYARLLTDTANALVAAPLGLVMLSSMAALSAARFDSQLSAILRRTILLCLPASLVLFVSSQSVVELVYRRGAFGAESAAITAQMLQGLSIGLWAQVAAYALIKGLNSQGRNLLASFTVSIGAIVWIASDVVLVRPLGAFGIGLGASLGAMAQLLCGAIVTRQARPLGRIIFGLSPLVLVGAVLFFWLRTQGVSEWLIGASVLILAAVWILAVPSFRVDVTRMIRSSGDQEDRFG